MTSPLQRPERVRRARHRLGRAVVREGAVVDEPEHPVEVDVGQHAGRRRHAALVVALRALEIGERPKGRPGLPLPRIIKSQHKVYCTPRVQPYTIR